MTDLIYVIPFLEPSQYSNCVYHTFKSWPQGNDVFGCFWHLLDHDEKKRHFEQFCFWGKIHAAQYAWDWYKTHIPTTTMVHVTLMTPVLLLQMISTHYTVCLTHSKRAEQHALDATIRYFTSSENYNKNQFDFGYAMIVDSHPCLLSSCLADDESWIKDMLEDMTSIGPNVLRFVLNRTPQHFDTSYLCKLSDNAITKDVSVLNKMVKSASITPHQIATGLYSIPHVVWTWLLTNMPRDNLRTCIHMRLETSVNNECGTWFQHDEFWVGDDPLVTISMMLEHLMWARNLLIWDFLVQQNCFVNYAWDDFEMEMLFLSDNSHMLECVWEPTDFWLSKYQQHVELACDLEATIILRALLAKNIPFDATCVLNHFPMILRYCPVDAFSNLGCMKHAKFTLRNILDAHRDNDMSDNSLGHRNATREFIWSLRPLTQAEICKIFCYVCPDTQLFFWNKHIVTADNLCQKDVEERVYFNSDEPIVEPCVDVEHLTCMYFKSSQSIEQFLKRIHFDVDFKHHTFLGC